MNVIQANPSTPHQTQPHFGQLQANAMSMPKWIKTVDPAFKWIQETRGRELLVIDVLGFTLLRVLVDLGREFIFKKTDDGERELNWSSARERLMMETLGTVPDFAVGLTGFGIGAFIDNALRKGKGPKAFSNKFTTIESLEAFQSILNKPDVHSTQGFIRELAKKVELPSHASTVESLLKSGVRSVIKQPDQAEELAENMAIALAKKTGQKAFDIKLSGQQIGFDNLILEASHFVGAMEQQVSKAPWRSQAKQLLSKTMKSNWMRIPIGAMIGLGINLTAPYLIQVATRKLDGIDDYPGVKGLRELKMEEAPAQGKDTKSKEEKSHFAPYVTENLKKGNLLPLLAALVPLPLALGMVDTEKLVTNPLKAFNKWGPGYLKRFAKFMQFSKGFPYVGGQQIAILYAIVLGARVGLSRNEIEFRERAIDGLLGWTTWILATPLIKKSIGSLMDSRFGTSMMKEVNGSRVLKSRAEITHLLADKPALKAKTLKRFLPIEWGSIIATIGLLGLVEPMLSVKWTEWQQRRMNAKHDLEPQQIIPTAVESTAVSSDVILPALSTSLIQPKGFPTDSLNETGSLLNSKNMLEIQPSLPVITANKTHYASRTASPIPRNVLVPWSVINNQTSENRWAFPKSNQSSLSPYSFVVPQDSSFIEKTTG